MKTLPIISQVSKSANAPALGRKVAAIITCLLALAVLAGCASTKVTNKQRLETGLIARPGNIWVYDFAATAADLPADSGLAGQQTAHATPQTAEEVAMGRQLGAQIATELVDRIRKLGMPSARAESGTKPQINDLVIRGSLLSVQEGSTAKRVAIGFGSGASELTTLVEGYQMTAQGLRKLGSATVDAGGGKTPGAAVGAAVWIATANPAGFIISTGTKLYGEASGSSKVEGRAKATAKEIAEVLEKRFQEQGWISK